MQLHYKAIAFSLLALLAVSVNAVAEVQIKPIEYHEHSSTLAGFIALPAGITVGVHPGVVVFHDWGGVSDFAKERAKRLAQAGYIAIVADVYGAGVRPKDSNEAGALAGRYKKDRPLLYGQLPYVEKLPSALSLLWLAPRGESGNSTTNRAPRG